VALCAITLAAYANSFGMGFALDAPLVILKDVQVPGPVSAEIATREAPVTFKTKVTLVSVPVVVRDSQGRAVGNLEKDDFQLFEDGKPQIVSRFSIERFADESAASAPAGKSAGAAPAEPARPNMPDRFVAYVFDDLHMRPEHLVWVRAAALRHLSASHNSLQRTAVYTTSGRTAVDFTGDRDLLRQALLAMVPRGGRTDLSGECPPMTEFMADLIANKHDQQALAVGIADYIACAGPIPGAADRVVESAARRALALSDADAGLVLDALDSVVGKLATMPGQRSLVVASPGFLVLDGRRQQQEAGLIDRAIRVNVIVHALDARGLEVRIPGGDASRRDLNAETVRQKADYERQSALQSSGVMANLASGTGGLFFENTNDAAGALERTSTPEYLYVLGFVPGSFKLDGKFHGLKVTLRNSKGLTLQARRGYYAPRYDEDPADQDKQQIEEAFFSLAEIRDLPADLQIQFFKTGGDTATVAVLAKLDLNRIPFRKEADRNRDDITIVSGLFDDNGNYVSGVQKILEMRLRDETLQRRKATGFTVRTDFNVKPGTYTVRLVVRDSEGKLLTARSGVIEVP
jgi:VWFA-related protein